MSKKPGQLHFFAITGFILGNYGLAELGVAVGLVGYFSKPKAS